MFRFISKLFRKRNYNKLRSKQRKEEKIYKTVSDFEPISSAAYRSEKNMKTVKKRPQSCPNTTGKTYVIDQIYDSEDGGVRGISTELEAKRQIAYYKHKWEESKTARSRELRRVRQLEFERDCLRNAFIEMVSVAGKLEVLIREGDFYRRETNRYRRKCELLENEYSKLKRNSFLPSNYQSLHFQPIPSTWFAPSFSETFSTGIITESMQPSIGDLPQYIVRLDDEDEHDEVKVFREEWRSPTPPSETTVESDSGTSVVFD